MNIQSVESEGSKNDAILNGIDHLIFVTPDLEASRKEFEALGFVVTPRNANPQFGIANCLVILEDSYFELLGVEDPDANGDVIEAFGDQLARGGDMQVLVLRTSDAHASNRVHRVKGFEMSPVSTWTRPAELENGETPPATFTTTAIASNAVPDAQFIYCQHHTPELVWRSAWQRHVNAARSLLSVTRPLSVPVIDAAADYVRLFDQQAVRENAESVEVELGPTHRLLLSEKATGVVVSVSGGKDVAAGVMVLESINGVSIELLPVST